MLRQIRIASYGDVPCGPPRPHASHETYQAPWIVRRMSRFHLPQCGHLGIWSISIFAPLKNEKAGEKKSLQLGVKYEHKPLYSRLPLDEHVGETMTSC